jgi:hypothetical protein
MSLEGSVRLKVTQRKINNDAPPARRQRIGENLRLN